VPWSAVEYLVGEGQFHLPEDYQYAILKDLGVLEAGSPDEVAAIVAKRFTNVPTEMGGGTAGVGGVRALPAATEGGWLEALFKIVQAIVKAFEAPKVKRDVLQCIGASRITIHPWGVMSGFDRDCTETLIAYLRKGGQALTSGSVISTVTGLGFSWWVALIIAASILVSGTAALAIAGGLEGALGLPGANGASINALWVVLLGLPGIFTTPLF
jgi:hypothetical protein